MYGKGTAQDFVPPLPESSAPPSNPRAPIQLQCWSSSLGQQLPCACRYPRLQHHWERRSVCGAALAPPAADLPHQLPQGLEMLLCLSTVEPRASRGWSTGDSKKRHQDHTKKGRNHHPESQQLNASGRQIQPLESGEEPFAGPQRSPVSPQAWQTHECWSRALVPRDAATTACPSAGRASDALT